MRLPKQIPTSFKTWGRSEWDSLDESLKQFYREIWRTPTYSNYMAHLYATYDVGSRLGLEGWELKKYYEQQGDALLELLDYEAADETRPSIVEVIYGV
jgi:hypothetical protein